MKRFLSGAGAILMAVVFLAAGVLNIVLGFNRMSKINAGKYIETQAKITNIESIEVADADAPGGTRTDYTITVEYTIDGKKYVSQLGEIPNEFHEGMELKVLYNIDKPTDLILPGNGGTVIHFVIGAVGVLAGIALFLQKLRGRG